MGETSAAVVFSGEGRGGRHSSSFHGFATGDDFLGCDEDWKRLRGGGGGGEGHGLGFEWELEGDAMEEGMRN
ncbi:hypothetical protein ACFX12_006696 [Malus domestica]